jgi:hypothetical protein
VAFGLAAEALGALAFSAAFGCLVVVDLGCVVVAFGFFTLGSSSGSSVEALRFVVVGLVVGATVDGFRDEAREALVG